MSKAAAFVSVVAGAVTVLVPSVSSASRPGAATIASITADGSGCPGGSVGISLPNDRRSATLIFDSFVASTGPGIPADLQTRDCRIHLDLDGPPARCDARGLTSFQYRGYEQLPAGGSAIVTAQLGNGTGRSPALTIEEAAGPRSRDYLGIDDVRTSRLMGASVLSVTVAVVGAGGSSAQTTVDSIDIKLAAAPGCS